MAQNMNLRHDSLGAYINISRGVVPGRAVDGRGAHVRQEGGQPQHAGHVQRHAHGAQLHVQLRRRHWGMTQCENCVKEITILVDMVYFDILWLSILLLYSLHPELRLPELSRIGLSGSTSREATI